MKTNLIAAFTLLATSLCAQQGTTVAAEAAPVAPTVAEQPRLDLRIEGGNAKLSAAKADETFFGVLLASLREQVLLPESLVIGAGVMVGGRVFDLGEAPALAAAHGMTIHLQGIALMRSQIVVSDRVTIGAVIGETDAGVPADPARPAPRKPLQQV